MNVRRTILQLTHQRGVLRPRDLLPLAIPRRHLADLVESGDLQKTARGLYSTPSTDLTEHQSLIEACVRVPAGIVCLLSALRFHSLTTQNPHEVWLAIPQKNRKPTLEYPPLRIARFSGTAYSLGIQLHKIAGAQVRVYEPAKTIADCFKFRNKIGIDVATEALRNGWNSRKATPDRIWHFAGICRVSRVMRPYLDMLQ